jgi:cytoskeletal protein CcmA (bactofilin family)
MKIECMSIADLKSKIVGLIRNSDSGESSQDIDNSGPTIIAKGLKIAGDLVGGGVIEIEGNVKGVIKSWSVVIRENGFVDGLITADFLHIRGKFNGEIKAKNVSIFEGAEVKGAIEYESISVEDGACLDARFKIIAS